MPLKQRISLKEIDLPLSLVKNYLAPVQIWIEYSPIPCVFAKVRKFHRDEILLKVLHAFLTLAIVVILAGFACVRNSPERVGYKLRLRSHDAGTF